MTSEQEAKEILKAHFDTNKKETGDTDTFGFGKLGDILTKDDHLLKHSILSADMPQKISMLRAIDSKINSSIIDIYLTTLLEANVSVKGQGRKDIIKLASSVAQGLQGVLAQKNDGLMRKFRRE